MSNTVTPNSTSSLDQVMSSIDMGPTDSLSFMYAQLQLAQASICIDTTTMNLSETWDVAITSLTNYQETLSTSTQTDMVLLQDFMGQYNSYIQGANKAATDGVQTLQSILTR